MATPHGAFFYRMSKRGSKAWTLAPGTPLINAAFHFLEAPRLMAKGMPNVMVGSVHRFPRERVVEWMEARGHKLNDGATPIADFLWAGID